MSGPARNVQTTLSRQENYIKHARGQECLASEIVREIRQKYDRKFNILELPEIRGVDHANNKVRMRFYDGRKYKKAWAESKELYGGSRMGLELSREVPAILYDLTKISVDEVKAFEGGAPLNCYH